MNCMPIRKVLGLGIEVLSSNGRLLTVEALAYNDVRFKEQSSLQDYSQIIPSLVHRIE